MRHYTAPTLIEHGYIVEETRGDCNCNAECCGKKPATDEGVEPDIGTKLQPIEP